MRHLIRYFFSYVLLGFLWLLHFLPLPVLRALGYCTGQLLFLLLRKRKHIVLTNLALCFPELSHKKQRKLARQHFIAFAQTALDRTKLWWSSRAYLEKIIKVQGIEELLSNIGKTPVIILTPHFLGMDASGTALSLYFHGIIMYSHQRNPVLDALFNMGRARFNAPIMVERTEGMLRIVKVLKQCVPFYFLPDMDLGRKNSVFVPFFGTPAATVTTLSRLVKITGAKVIPCIAHMTKQGYDVFIEKAWENFPSCDETLDSERMNAYIESRVRIIPEQYYWVHRRFKTRPPGAPKIY